MESETKNPLTARFARWEGNADLPVPSYSTSGSAGFDLRAAVDVEGVVVGPGERALIATGFSVALPPGYELQVRPRSGLAVKFGIGVVNSPGTVDSDYRGQIAVCLINLGAEKFEIKRGDRIAQAVIAAAPQWTLLEVDQLDATERGSGGFGSTGVA